jgi:hypothetical protein
MGKFGGIEPICYARNADIAGLLVFQPGKKTPHKKSNAIIIYFSNINDGCCCTMYDDYYDYQRQIEIYRRR